MDEPRSQTRIQSVSRAVGLLLAIAESPDGETAKQLADRAGLSLATTYHLLTTLWAEGMLTKDESRVFRLGPKAMVIADAYQRLTWVPAEYRTALHSVARKTGEAVYLGVWRNGGVQVIDKVEGAHAVRVVGLDVGFTEDVHARASGKLLLAFAPDELRTAILNRSRLRPVTAHTITKKSDLLAEFATIRETGLAYDREEFQIGVKCVSVPLWRAGEVAACLTASAPSQRFDATKDAVIAALREAASSV
ncbi:IclR family transcriptional regulator [Streptomyces hainanensis]|uniref:IclR family transcriptional regulator n=1 Tax=Streptomyces hainanensis TaxID=402648 RepID=A0A4V2Y4J1_9ACTN|nr:IclR family transcriptional regulator [Streptomyces hainanensis]